MIICFIVHEALVDGPRLKQQAVLAGALRSRRGVIAGYFTPGPRIPGVAGVCRSRGVVVRNHFGGVRRACVRVWLAATIVGAGAFCQDECDRLAPESCSDVSPRASSMWAPGKRLPSPRNNRARSIPRRGGCGFRLSARL